MKPGKYEVKAEIKFEPDELYLLQDNAWQMVESFGLDRRIASLTGKRKVGFYSWDLETLESVVFDLRKSPENKEVAERVLRKIEDGYREIEKKRHDR